MIKSIIIGITGITALLLVWVAIQYAWGIVFKDYAKDADVLAGRSSCTNCGCTEACEIKKQNSLTLN